MQRFLLLLTTCLFASSTPILAQTDSIQHVGTIDLPATGFEIGLKKPYLYALLGDESIQVYDVSNPKRVKNVGRVRFDGIFASDIDVSGGYCYLYGIPYDKFTIFNLEKPASPKEIGSLKLPWSGSGIWNAAHTKNYSYITSGDTLYVVNTKNKTQPFIENGVASPHSSSWLIDIFVLSDAIYVAVDDGILIFDNTKPAAPSFHSFFEAGFRYMSVDASNNRVYMAHKSGSAYSHSTIDISDHFKPKLLFNEKGDSLSGGNLVYKNGILAQIGTHENGKQPLTFYNVGNKNSSLIKEIECTTKNGIADIAAMGSLFFVVKNGDVEIYEHTGPNSSVRSMAETNIDIYPNPTQNSLNFKIKNSAHETLLVRLIDQQGKVVLNEQIQGSSAALQMGHLKWGMYYCEISDGRTILLSRTIMKSQ